MSSSFEKRFYLHNPTLRQRLGRDIRLLIDSCVFLLIWATKGWKLRRALKEAEEKNSVLILEDHLGD